MKPKILRLGMLNKQGARSTFPSVTDLDTLANALAAFGHPTRLRIAVLLSEAVMSPVQATARIEGSKLGVVAYHFRSLHAAGLIRQTSTRPRRGAVEHFYALTNDGMELLNTLGLLPECGGQRAASRAGNLVRPPISDS